MLEEQKILGRSAGDHERLFPHYTTASAACSGEVEVNGKKLIIWEFSQLETLKPAVLKQRAMAIRDAVGENNCPPIPSMQHRDLTRWILHMQNVLTNSEFQVGRAGVNGRGVPPSFKQEHQERPILKQRESSPKSKPAPFGPRKIDDTRGMEATRDHYSDLLEQKKEFAEAKVQGLSSLRVGGEGRKKIQPTDNMVCNGISNADPQGIQSMRMTPEGRRSIQCADHVADQMRELEDIDKGRSSRRSGVAQGIESGRMGGEGMRHIGVADHLFSDGGGGYGGYPSNRSIMVPSTAEPEPHIGGERKKHMSPMDHMLNHGTAADMQNPHGIGGRRHLGSFSGLPSNGRMSGDHPGYRASWKKDPSRLLGTSMIV